MGLEKIKGVFLLEGAALEINAKRLQTTIPQHLKHLIKWVEIFNLAFAFDF
jgi:hypothetical protein